VYRKMRHMEYVDGSLVVQVTPEMKEESDILAAKRRHDVQGAMLHAWSNYEKYAMGKDELLPMSQNGRDNWGGMAMTLVDSLDTLWLMDLKKEFYEARDWVRDHLDYSNVHEEVSTFETTIRNLGGMLSAYELSGDEVFLGKAEDLGSRLLRSAMSYEKGNTIPKSRVYLNEADQEKREFKKFDDEAGDDVRKQRKNIGLYDDYDYGADPKQKTEAKDGRKGLDKYGFDDVSMAGYDDDVSFYSSYSSSNIAELGSLQLEFRYLSKVSGDEKYGKAAMIPFDKLAESQPSDGLFPVSVSNGIGDQKYSLYDKISFGSMGDSAYEYMLKLWLQSGKTEHKYRHMYDLAIEGLHEKLLHRSTPSGLTYITQIVYGDELHHMEEFVCFAGGMLALGAFHDPEGFESSRAQRDFTTAKALTYTCYQMHARTDTGLAGNNVIFVPGADFQYSQEDQTHQLRPEFVESLYILYYITGDPMYREWGWEYFEALEKYSKVEGGYTSVKGVHSPSPWNEDSMESFFLAETLKYLYLLFGGDKENNLLNKYVLTTEAHPLGIFRNNS